MTDERLKEIGEMMLKAPQKDAVTQDVYGNSVIILNAGVAPELYVALLQARGEAAVWKKRASPEVSQQVIDQANEIHRLKHQIAKLHDTIHELKESTRSATSGEESSSDDTEST